MPNLCADYTIGFVAAVTSVSVRVHSFAFVSLWLVQWAGIWRHSSQCEFYVIGIMVHRLKLGRVSVKLWAMFKGRRFLFCLLNKTNVILTKHRVDYVCSCDCVTAFFIRFDIDMTRAFFWGWGGVGGGCIYLQWQVDDASAAAAAAAWFFCQSRQS